MIESSISWMALIVVPILALIALSVVMGLVWLVVDKKTRPFGLGILVVGAAGVLLAGVAITHFWTAAEEQQARVAEHRKIAHEARAKAEQEAARLHQLQRDLKTGERVAEAEIRVEEVRRRAEEVGRLQDHLNREAAQVAVSHKRVLILAPLVVLGGLAMLVVLVLLLANKNTRPVVLGLLGLAIAVAVVLGAYLLVGVRMESRDVRVAQPSVRSMELPSGAEVIVTPPAATAEQDAELPAETSGYKSLLRTVGMAIGRAIADEKKEQAKSGGKPSKIRSALAEAPPAWVGSSPDVDQDGAYVTSISVGPYKTRLDCNAELPGELDKAVSEYVQASVGRAARDRIGLPTDYVQQNVVQEEWEEWKEYESPLGEMLTVHKRLVFDDRSEAKLQEQWNSIVTAERMVGVGAVAGALLALLATAFAYLKIDLATAGAYRGRLRVGVGAVVLTLGLLGFMMA